MKRLPLAQSHLALLCLHVMFWPIVDATAQTIGRPRDDGFLNIPDVRIDVPQIGDPITEESTTSTSEKPPELDDDDLKANPQIASLVLGRSVQRRNWRTVRRVMAYYTDIPGHDPMLALHAQGALDRQDGRHGRAIAAYRRMLDQDENLDPT